MVTLLGQCTRIREPAARWRVSIELLMETAIQNLNLRPRNEVTFLVGWMNPRLLKYSFQSHGGGYLKSRDAKLNLWLAIRIS